MESAGGWKRSFDLFSYEQVPLALEFFTLTYISFDRNFTLNPTHELEWTGCLLVEMIEA